MKICKAAVVTGLVAALIPCAAGVASAHPAASRHTLWPAQTAVSQDNPNPNQLQIAERIFAALGQLMNEFPQDVTDSMRAEYNVIKETIQRLQEGQNAINNPAPPPPVQKSCPPVAPGVPGFCITAS